MCVIQFYVKQAKSNFSIYTILTVDQLIVIILQVLVHTCPYVTGFAKLHKNWNPIYGLKGQCASIVYVSEAI